MDNIDKFHFNEILLKLREKIEDETDPDDMYILYGEDV
jgi:hypothetical protein